MATTTNAASNLQFRLAPASRGVHLRLLAVWAVVLLAAMAYCWMHSSIADGGQHDPLITLRWATTHWGGWPLLLPLCYALIRRLQFRIGLAAALALAAPLAIAGAAIAAWIIDWLWGGPWTLAAALYRMIPIAGGTYLVFVALAFWLLHPALLSPRATPLSPAPAAPMLAVSTGSREQRIGAEQICWVQGARNYAELHAGSAQYIMRSSMRELEEMLSAHGFIRIHRSYLVNRKQVDALQQRRGEVLLRLRDGTELPVGRTYREQVAQNLG